MLTEPKPTVTMHQIADGKHNMSLLWLYAAIKVVLMSLNIPITSNHSFTRVERVVGGEKKQRWAINIIKKKQTTYRKAPGWWSNP